MPNILHFMLMQYHENAFRIVGHRRVKVQYCGTFYVFFIVNRYIGIRLDWKITIHIDLFVIDNV